MSETTHHADMDKRVMDTRTAVALNHPFLAPHLYRSSTVIYDPKAPTAYTDGQTIGLGDWVCSLPLEQRMYILAHEVVHDMLNHPARGKLYADRHLGPDMQAFDADRYNRAADYVVNAMVDALGCGERPDSALTDPAVTAQSSVDAVYLDTPGSAPKDDPSGDPGDQGDGQGQDEGEPGASGHGGFDEHRPPPPSTDTGTDSEPEPEALEDEARRNVAAAINAAKQAGSLPGSLERALAGFLEPKRSWIDELRDFVTSHTGRDETSWARPHRRRLMMPPHIPYPGTDGCTVDCLVVAVDVSGSVMDNELGAFVTEFRAILDQVRPRETHMIAWDSAVTHHVIESSEDLDDLEVRGGGGSRYGVVPQLIHDMALEPDLVVSFTDGCVHYPDPSHVPWPHVTVYTYPSAGPAPFGHSVFMDPNEYG